MEQVPHMLLEVLCPLHMPLHRYQPTAQLLAAVATVIQLALRMPLAALVMLLVVALHTAVTLLVAVGILMIEEVDLLILLVVLMMKEVMEDIIMREVAGATEEDIIIQEVTQVAIDSIQ